MCQQALTQTPQERLNDHGQWSEQTLDQDSSGLEFSLCPLHAAQASLCVCVGVCVCVCF